jgi:drug/metabolite transporter (DMT)-like permease
MAERMADTETRPGLAIAWMIVTGLCFVAVTALVKTLGTRIPAPEAAFLRFLFGIAFMLPMLRSLLALRPTPRQWRLTLVRGVAHTAAVTLWFFAMTRIPIAEVTAMNYLAPVYVTILAVFVLGETLAFRRILAICAALLGAALILRPGFRALDPGHVAMLFAALCFAVSFITAKILSGELPAAAIVALMSLSVTIGLAPLALSVWVWPTLWELGLLIAVAGFATAGHYTMTLAYAAAPITVTQPVTFLQLVWAVLVGALFFGEPADPFVIAGGAMIMGSVVFITWREAVLKRRVTPDAGETKA